MHSFTTPVMAKLNSLLREEVIIGKIEKKTPSDLPSPGTDCCVAAELLDAGSVLVGVCPKRSSTLLIPG